MYFPLSVVRSSAVVPLSCICFSPAPYHLVISLVICISSLFSWIYAPGCSCSFACMFCLSGFSFWLLKLAFCSSACLGVQHLGWFFFKLSKPNKYVLLQKTSHGRFKEVKNIIPLEQVFKWISHIVEQFLAPVYHHILHIPLFIYYIIVYNISSIWGVLNGALLFLSFLKQLFKRIKCAELL